jgi:hypothetical protein
VAHGGGKGPAIGHGGANAPGVAHSGGKGQAIGHGGANAPGVAHGGGFGFGHASLGNPTLGSHSQNTSHKGETHDGRSFFNHTDPSKNADQVEQVDDRGPGKEKGLVDSLPGQEQQADRGMTLNPATIHSDPDNIGTLGPSPDQELQPDRGLTLNLETIHSDLDDIVTRGLKPGQELQADPGGGFNPETTHSDLDGIVTRGLKPGQELQADPGGGFNPETTHSDLDGIVTLGRPPSQDLQSDRSDTLNLGTIHSDFDDIATRRLPLRLEVNLHRGKSLPASQQAKVALGISVPSTDDTSAIVPRDRWSLGDDLIKMLHSINPGLGINPRLGDNVDANAMWKLPWGIALIPLVPCFGALLLFVSGIVKSGLTGQKIPKREQRKPYGAHLPALDKFTEAFLIIRERQQKAVDEKTRGLLKQLSGDPDVEKGRDGIRGSSGNRTDL